MRITIKLLLISELVLLVAVLVLVVPVWRAMRGQIVTDMQNELKAIAATAALGVDGDLHASIRTTGDEQTSAFREIRRQLQDVQVANGLPYERIYTFYPDGDQMRFAVMLHPEPFVGDPYPRQTLMVPVLEDGAMEATELYEDDHGRWISAYAPIRNRAGAIVGLLEVDKSSATYLAAFEHYTRLTIGVGLLALVVSSLLGWFVLRWTILKPLSAVRDGMLALGRQDFAHRVTVRTGDELEDLARTFNGLAQQLDLAKVIQASFFPTRMPVVPGYDVAGMSLPCDATGGDYFDAIALPGHRIAVVVADVSGHGIGPSLLMSGCRAAIHALSRTDCAPQRMLERLADLLRRDLTGGRFITMIYGIMEPDGTFTYANAGHGPALLARNGGVETLGPHRPPLGIDIPLDDEPGETSLRLQPGDRVLLASDGLPEAMTADGVYFGAERITAVMAERDADAAAVVTRLQAELVEHCGGPSRTDDVTILCVDRTAGVPAA
ncbi:MAG: SpoIIE family protein phosphatase [Phycisphaerales bacterium]|nr:SpoIIE family protein phosphatase [Phycisphaerae bacterium]NNF43932.1 SpoIIE family protein phosphatase [Phycisphaerales bacterium]NNM26384.1 SpoIIE family protein phosphatase [Phycisphaerales bacterium]